jgi:hypothetical protein
LILEDKVKTGDKVLFKMDEDKITWEIR